MNEIDLLSEWGASITPSGAQVQNARTLLETQIAGRRRPGRWAGRVRLTRRAMLTAAALLITAAAATAAVYQFSPEAALESEGRSLVPGSIEQKRSVVVDDLVWTAHAYATDDGLVCLDFDLTGRTDGSGLGSFGGCTDPARSPALLATVGTVRVGDINHQAIGGIASDIIATIRISGAGEVLNDVPINGVWLIIPSHSAKTWHVEGLDATGTVVESTTVAGPDAP